MSENISEVTQAVLGERQNRDRGWWEHWADGFTDDAFINMSWIDDSAKEFVRRTKEQSAQTAWGHHRLSPPTVHVCSGRAIAELPLGIEFRIDVDGVEADLTSYCRSQYRLRHEQGKWKIAGITSIYERDIVTAAIPGVQLSIDPAQLMQFRASYRCLAWYHDRAGRTIQRELPGDDRPDLVKAVYDAEWAWLKHAG
ncbi:hypothetical protein BFW87_00600 [Pseudomonas fluorescens]|uniref:SnoaL-like domain-containing protein n=1 Tax=Pseudomonas fluorescens TaxID=294 RepID=A0A1T2Z8G7_PSEFL|nr:nuclear transport factor 2 family protein [Pseudomonas fluorescens]OPB00941.1 hypothetical protein BFW87_00600 [Pseudomonas fluorescens]